MRTVWVAMSWSGVGDEGAFVIQARGCSALAQYSIRPSVGFAVFNQSIVSTTAVNGATPTMMFSCPAVTEHKEVEAMVAKKETHSQGLAWAPTGDTERHHFVSGQFAGVLFYPPSFYTSTIRLDYIL